MSVYLLDTDTLSLIQFGHATVVQRLATHPAADVTISVLSLQEQMKGWLAWLNRLRTPAQLGDW